MKQLTEIRNERLIVNLHRGQQKAHDSRARFVVVTAGLQSGKTSYGPHWCLREAERAGPGDYLIATPTYPLLELKLLPEFRRLFEHQMQLGDYVASPYRRFIFSDDGMRRLFGDRYDVRRDDQSRVLFGYAADPESLESSTCKWAWLDECGQKKFKLGSWESIQGRLSLARGRVLMTTSLYALNWLKMLVDQAKHDHSIQVVQFESVANPNFSRDEFERMRRTLPLWKFNLRYRGLFERPAGLIYACFDERKNLCPRFAIPATWPRFLGLDFGGVNMVGLFFAEEPKTKKLYAYRAYRAGSLESRQHVERLLKGEPMIPYCVGGSKSEDQWRKEFRAAGLPVRAPDITDVEVGIDRVYSAMNRGGIVYFDDLAAVLEEKRIYSRVLDEKGEPTDEIEDKSDYHFLDAERYIIGRIRAGAQKKTVSGKIDFYGLVHA